MPASVAHFFSESCSEAYDQRRHLDYKLPIHFGLVEGIKSKPGIKRLCMRMLLRTCIALQHNKPPACPFVRVVASISLPAMFSSRVTVFFDEEYFSHFFDRKGPGQTWAILPSNRNLLQQWQLSQEFPINGIGYREHIVDEDCSYTGEIWFYGDVGEFILASD